MLPCRWNINRRLARFVNDPKEFRSRLGEADALISGTFALLFFAQLYCLDSGLDIYVRQGSKADALIRYIGDDKSYEFDHSYGWSDDDPHRTLTKVLIFRRIVPPGSPQIRFHLTRTSPLHSILTDCAFSTAHVNIITWDKAYYEAMGQILSKYSAHGWRTSDWVDYDQARGCNKPGIRENLRTIGDSSTWVIPLNLYKIHSGSPGSRHMGLKTFAIGAQTFSCCMLTHTYTFHAPDTSWMVFLREKLSRMIMLEVLKTGDANLITTIRQSDFMSGDHKDCPLLRSRPRFERPEGWEFVDHMLPAWLEEWNTASTCEKDRHKPIAVETYANITSEPKERPVSTLLDNHHGIFCDTSSFDLDWSDEPAQENSEQAGCLSVTKVPHRSGLSSAIEVWMLATSSSYRIIIVSLRIPCTRTKIQRPTVF
ncbi:hypothetical protein KCU65_g1915, partial [Aureobasidium melanogenum]